LQVLCKCTFATAVLHIKACPQSLIRYAEFFRPLSQLQLLALIFNDLEEGLTISRLLLDCSPTGVPWLVVAGAIRIPVDSVARRRFRPHVCEEINERVSPPFADGYAFCSIQVELVVLRILAPPNHVQP